MPTFACSQLTSPSDTTKNRIRRAIHFLNVALGALYVFAFIWCLLLGSNEGGAFKDTGQSRNDMYMPIR